MKTIKSLLMVVAALFAGALGSLNAQEAQYSVKELSDSKIEVLAISNDKSQYTIQLKNQNNVVFQREFATEGASRKHLDFSNLRKGSYELVIADEQKVMVVPVEYLAKQVVIKHQVSERKLQAPVFNFQEGIFTFSYLNPVDQNVYVKIVDSWNKVVFETSTEEFLVHNRLDVSKLPKGEYFVVLDSKINNYSSKFVID